MKILKNKLIKKNYLGNGFRLDETEIPPSMLIDYNKKLLKIWKFIRNEGFNILVPIPSIISIDYEGNILLNSLDKISKKSINSPSLNIYFKYCVNKLLLLEKNPSLVYLFRRAKFMDAKEFLFFPNLLNKILPYKLLTKISYSRIAPLIIMKNYLKAFKLYFFNSKHDMWIDIILETTQKKINQLKLGKFSGSWTNYYSSFNLNEYVSKQEKLLIKTLDLRQKTIFRILKNLKHGSVLDIASNRGMFSLLAVRAGHSVLSVDNDISTIDHLYNFKKKFKLPIIPAVLDFNEFSKEKINRFKSPYVLALGFTHHLYLVQKMEWNSIASILASLTKNTLITEFKPGTLAYGSEVILTEKWKKNYSLESFLSSLKKFFKSVQVVNKTKKEKRIIVVCKK